MDGPRTESELDRFRYDLPGDAIAQSPAEPRDAARLLDARTMTDHTVRELPQLLESGDVVVVNNTRVRAARLSATKETGGAVEILLLSKSDSGWECLLRPARRIRAGMSLRVGDATATVVSEPDAGKATLRFDPSVDVEALARRDGSVPLPPYITGSIAPERYQTVYADRVGSAAAPTAGLHLTGNVLSALEARGIEVATVDLEVGLGTFRPITASRLVDHQMHAERYEIPARTADLVRSGRRVVAIGTTVVRALESAGRSGSMTPGAASTDLFITPGFEFRVVDLLMTNFHVPGSSLVVMIAAFMGSRWRDVYDHALARSFRFLSFGDAMLCERQ